MKSIKKLSFLFLFSFFITSCGILDIKPDNNDNSGKSSASKISGSMKATLDGKAWASKSVRFGGSFALIQINGIVDESNYISLELDDSKLKTNYTYELNSEESKKALQSLVVLRDNTIFLGKSGTLKITKYTRGKIVEGEINAMIKDAINPEIELKNCKFSMTYN